ncbi:hypothetical protein G9A89_000250, partial [Geosiphon pyriformis]
AILCLCPDIRFLIFDAHSQILAARSPYFAIVLFNNWVKRISFDEHRVPIILELLIAVNELILENLIDHLEDYLIEHYTKELEENFATQRKLHYAPK